MVTKNKRWFCCTCDKCNRESKEIALEITDDEPIKVYCLECYDQKYK